MSDGIQVFGPLFLLSSTEACWKCDTRQTVIGMLRDMQITVHERYIQPGELADFEQCWLTGTAAEVTPVGQIGDYIFEVGDLTRRVATEYEKLVRA